MKVLRSVFKILLVAAFWIGVWAIAAWRVELPLLLPSPAEVFNCLGELLQTKAFYSVTANSLWNVLLGLLLAVGCGTVLAIVTAYCKPVRELLLPLMTVVKATPVASFIILALIWMGAARVPTFITFLIVLPIIWTNIDEGISKTDPLLLEMAEVYQMPFLRRLRLLVLPSVKPYFMSACRTSMGLAWKAGIAAEIIAMPKQSIGTMIGDAKQYLETDDMFAWTLTVILFSLIIELLLTSLLNLWGRDRRKAVSK